MLVSFITKTIRPFIATLNFLTPLGDLIVRCWIAYIFFTAGLLKLQSWDTTVSLFAYEYHVPLLPPYWAAVIGTAAEIVLPILLVLGLGGRFCILIFFIYNLTAAVSYPFLWTPDGSMGLQEHINWGLLLMLLMLHGPGKLSIDHWLHLRHKYRLLKSSSQPKFFHGTK
jgi:putative oxidoreductase